MTSMRTTHRIPLLLVAILVAFLLALSQGAARAKDPQAPRLKKILVGSGGSDHLASFWSWRHFTYFFAQGCFFAWCKRPLRFLAGTVLSNIVLRRMGCRIGKRTVVRWRDWRSG